MVTRKVRVLLMRILFGSHGLGGYYVPPNNTNTEKKYVFSSVFPSRATMNIALNGDSLQ